MTAFCYFAKDSRYGYDVVVLRALKPAVGEQKRMGKYTCVFLGFWDSIDAFWTDARSLDEETTCSELMAKGVVICPNLNIARLQLDLQEQQQARRAMERVDDHWTLSIVSRPRGGI